MQSFTVTPEHLKLSVRMVAAAAAVPGVAVLHTFAPKGAEFEHRIAYLMAGEVVYGCVRTTEGRSAVDTLVEFTSMCEHAAELMALGVTWQAYMRGERKA